MALIFQSLIQQELNMTINIKTVLVSNNFKLLCLILFFSCNTKTKEVIREERCYETFMHDKSHPKMNLKIYTTKYQNKDSVFINEMVKKISNKNEVEKIMVENNYLVIGKTLYKKFTNNLGKDIYVMYLTSEDTNVVSNLSYSEFIGSHNLNFQLFEKNEKRKYLGANLLNGDTLNKFIIETNQIDGAKYYSFYNKEFTLIKQYFISSSSDIDSIILQPNCR